MNDKDEEVEDMTQETEEERQEYLAKLMVVENQMLALRNKIEERVKQLEEK